MTLIIDPTTDQGKNYIEAIGWAQTQMNAILERFFNGKHRLIKGIKLQFQIDPKQGSQEKIKVGILELAPKTEEGFDLAVKEAKTVHNLRPDILVPKKPSIIVPKGVVK
jgi:hypothetical protein